MENKINRREFLTRGMAGLAGLTIAGSLGTSVAGAMGAGSVNLNPTPNANPMGRTPKSLMVDRVPLGATGLKVSRMAMGTGTVGVNHSSNQVKLGMETFVKMFRHGYDRGVRFADMAENYGSMPFIGEAIKGLPRRNLTLLSKIWTQPDDSPQREEVRPIIERYLRELGTDHIDILLMHCMMSGDWNTTRTHYMEAFSRAKEEGIVQCVGVSCHNIDALRTAAASPWVDVIMARINPFGTIMDADPDTVKEVLHTARANGKGVVGMKIFGEGKHVTEPEREKSIRFGIHESGIHALTMGFESIAQMDDAIDRVIRISNE